MDSTKHNETINHLIDIVEEMNDLGWTKIDIQKIEDIVEDTIDDLAKVINKSGVMSIEREIWKSLIIKNAKTWCSTKGNKVFHTYADCSAGNNIEPEYIDIVIPKGYIECKICKG